MAMSITSSPMYSQGSTAGSFVNTGGGGSSTPNVNATSSIPTLPDETQTQSSLPLPPQAYVPQYTDENVRRGRAPKPPPPPASHETYMVFGVTYHADDAIIRPLESQGIRRLYPQNFDHRRELKKMNHSVLVNFLDLLDILIHCPDAAKRQEKIDDIQLLFIHMHHLINEFRPHQARETLRVMMEVQKRQTLETCDRFQKHLEMSVEIIKSALNNLPEQLEADTKLLAATETFFTKSKPQNKEAVVSSLDQMMCDIADSL